MKTISHTEFHVHELLSGYIDSELTQQDRQRVRLHCEQCRECAEQLEELQALRGKVAQSTLSDVGKEVWRETTNDVTAKASRSIGWLLFIGGLLIAAGVALFEFVKQMDSMSPRAILIVGGIYGGLLLLFISVLRQRLVERKTDRYKDVEI
jgi:hypothetical protein